MLKERKGVNVILALTDGLDNSSHISVEKVIKHANRHKIPIFNIGLGDVDQSFLKNISEQTHGDFYYTNNSNSLNAIYAEVQNRIQSIYDLTYTSNNLNLTESNRTVEISFNIDSIYLKNNIVDFDLPEETIEHIKAKRNNAKYKTIAYSITGVAIAGGVLLFVFRRRKKKKSQTSSI